MIAGRVLVPESRDPVARAIDWTGAALSGVALVTLVWAVIEAPSDGWTSPAVIEAFVIAAIATVAFLFWERRIDEPLLDVRLFANARFTAASATVTILFFALFGFLFLSTQYLQFVLDYSPLAAGVHMLPYAAAMIVAAPLSSKLVERFGTKRIVTTGMLAFAAGLAVAATATTTSGYRPLGIGLLLMGVGMGLAGAPATESIMGALPADRAGIGSAVNDTTRELGGALGVAIVGSIVGSLYGRELGNTLPDSVPAPAAEAARESLGAAVHLPGDAGGQLAGVARDAFVHAMSRGALVVAVIAALGAVVAWRFLPARPDAAPAEALEPASNSREIAGISTPVR